MEGKRKQLLKVAFKSYAFKIDLNGKWDGGNKALAKSII